MSNTISSNDFSDVKKNKVQSFWSKKEIWEKTEKIDLGKNVPEGANQFIDGFTAWASSNSLPFEIKVLKNGKNEFVQAEIFPHPTYSPYMIKPPKLIKKNNLVISTQVEQPTFSPSRSGISSSGYVAETPFVDVPLEITEGYFQFMNKLLVDSKLGQIVSRYYQDAMTGFDVSFTIVSTKALSNYKNILQLTNENIAKTNADYLKLTEKTYILNK